MCVSYRLALIVGVALAGCGGKQEGAQRIATDSSVAQRSMAMPAPGAALMAAMGSHLDSVAVMAPTQMVTAMAAHQDLAARVMDAMGSDMRAMNMAPDSAWSALSDSLRQDLATLPGLTAPALKSRMTAHIDRMRRMMAMHQEMMKM